MKHTEKFQTVISYYLRDYDTDVTNFDVKIKKNENRYSFSVHPNPNSSIANITDTETVNMAIV
ncbi:MAG: hypothetical protein ACC656_05505, partial [Candidatus Heimdallarchaeota archaeon]